VAREFLTVPDELLECANLVADHFASRGHTVSVEPKETEYPYRPTLRCKRERTTMLVEAVPSLDLTKAEEWARYAKSASRDVRVALALPADVERSAADDQACRDLGVGLYAVSDARTAEVVAPMDLSLNLEPPAVKNLPKPVQKVVGAAYDQFDRAQWREGFEEICQQLERCARKYLKEGLASGRITLQRPGGAAWAPTEAQVERMTLGQLKDAYAAIQNPNHVDSITATALKRINRDRVGVAHHKTKPATETRLRKNVGRHIWLAINTLRELLA
jgi:hypothetical protein